MSTLAESIEPRHAAAALDALDALGKAGGRVEASLRRSATNALMDFMAPTVRAELYRSPAEVLGVLAEVGAIDYVQGEPPPGLDIAWRSIVLSITKRDDFDASRLAPLRERAASFDPSKSWAVVGSPQSRAIARALRKPLHDKAGRALGALAAQVGTSKDSTSSIVKAMEIVGYVKCERGSRKTYSIELTKLVPRSWLIDETPEPEPIAVDDDDAAVDALLAAADVEPVEVVDVEDEPLPDVEPVAIVDEEDFAVQSANANDVAFALLELVMARARTSLEPDHRMAFLQTELDDARHKIAQTTEYAAALRRQLGEASDELVATKQERNMLRQRLASVERNLADVLRRNGTQTTAAFRDGVQHALDKIMRDLPSARA
jgi:hypothetical protein